MGLDGRFKLWSLSARRAWIEIRMTRRQWRVASSSLSARRAWIEISSAKQTAYFFCVALRKESVDRNDAMQIVVVVMRASLSARRAWIEIIEEVSKYVVKESLSARRAWIEIIDYVIDYANDAVALRKESVDRN